MNRSEISFSIILFKTVTPIPTETSAEVLLIKSKELPSIKRMSSYEFCIKNVQEINIPSK